VRPTIGETALDGVVEIALMRERTVNLGVSPF
jgi:hypothetical protein